MDLAIQLKGAVKRYGEITAVDGLDLEVPFGTCVGLLGPNGAGKSTTMRLLTAQSIADEGELSVLGFRLPQESKQARAECGVVPQLDNLDTTLTVAQNLRVFAHLYRIPRAERHEAVERTLGIAKLSERRDARVDELSGGMRRRLLIARALVHRPRLLLAAGRADRRARRARGGGGLRASRAARRGRVRRWRGGRVSAATTPRRRLHRLERPALGGVLAREVMNFSSYWRSTSCPIGRSCSPS